MKEKILSMIERVKRKNAILFLVCLCVSFVGWFVLKSKEDFEVEVHIPIRLVDIPRFVYSVRGLTAEVDVVISDKGENLISIGEDHTYDTLELSYSSLEEVKSNAVLNSSELRDFVKKRLPASSKIVSIIPSTLEFPFTRNAPKIVDVKFVASYSPKRNHSLSGEVEYSPKRIKLIGIPEVLDTITALYTERASFIELEDTLRTTLRLIQPEGTFADIKRVNVMIPIEELTQKKFVLPITMRNVPEGYRMTVFPSSADVTCVLCLGSYTKMDSSYLKVVADYRNMDTANNKKVIPLIVEKVEKDFKFSVNLLQKNVDYVLEKQLNEE
ncbi:MAG TPA: hypothetical protein DDY68_02150 [Porphyromonadaceae bacterium]|nr:hypothetical protein [Porphyromonadaceae bacterium]